MRGFWHMIEKTVLQNGLTIITEPMDGDFVNVAYYVNKGSIDEPEDCLGIAHLAEHEVFKGTANRNKDEVWEDVQKYGGEMNAYTAENSTAFFCTILKEYWDKALDVISDIVFNNTIPEEEFELEKGVVIEELKMYDDDAKHKVFDETSRVLFKDYKNRWNNGGTPETVQGIKREQLVDFINNNYIPQNITLFVTGNVKHEDIEKFVEDYLDGYEFINDSQEHRVTVDKLNITDDVISLHGTQSTMMAVWETKASGTRELLLNEILCSILGGGFGSRFMEIREKYGYAYTVNCNYQAFAENDKAFMFCYAGLNKDNIPKTKELIIQNLKDIKENGLRFNEFNQAKICVKSDYKKQFSFCEDVNNFRLMQYPIGGTIYTEELLKVLEKITIQDVENFAKEILQDMKIGFIVVEQTE